MEDLERKFKSLKLALQQNEPERAERLQQTLNKAKELLIQKRMGDITQAARPGAARHGHRRPEGAAGRYPRAAGAAARRKERQRQGPRGIRAAEPVEERDREHHSAGAGREARERPASPTRKRRWPTWQAKIKALEAVIAAAEGNHRRHASGPRRGHSGSGQDRRATRQALAQKAEAIANQIAKEAGDEKGPFEAKPRSRCGGEGRSRRTPKPGEGSRRRRLQGRRRRRRVEGQ